MVDEVIGTKFKCPYCLTEYDSEEEAIDCRANCQMHDPIIDLAEITYICEMCKKEFESFGDAEDCEEEHKLNMDDAWKRIGLTKARDHPDQKRLTVPDNGRKDG